MKNYLLILVAVASLVLTSCSKDDDNKKNDLAGTTWVASQKSTNYSWEETIAFTSASSFTYTYSETEYGSTTSESASGTYSYDAPKVTGKITANGQTSTMEGIVKGNSLEVSMDGEYYETYTKK